MTVITTARDADSPTKRDVVAAELVDAADVKYTYT
jgi:hypothetical protein